MVMKHRIICLISVGRRFQNVRKTLVDVSMNTLTESRDLVYMKGTLLADPSACGTRL